MVRMIVHGFGLGLPVILFAAILIFLRIGRRLGERRMARDGTAERAGSGTLDGAIFGLMGLLLAFTFSGAAARFDKRRELIVEEANIIGTAYLRLDLVTPERRAVLQERFRAYLDSRIAAYRLLPDVDAAYVEIGRSIEIQKEIWSLAIEATKAEGGQALPMFLLPALNQLIDIVTTRTFATRMHPPVTIYVMLGVLVLVCALFAGFGSAGIKSRSALHEIGFAIVLAATVYITVDIEIPRLGYIRVDAFDQALVELRQSMD